VTLRIGKWFAIAAAVAASTYGTVAFAEGADQAELFTKSSTSSVALKKNTTSALRSKKVYLGRAPYICGPSGFGTKSTCFLRASL
jgi:hypothetical protein